MRIVCVASQGGYLGGRTLYEGRGAIGQVAGLGLLGLSSGGEIAAGAVFGLFLLLLLGCCLLQKVVLRVV